MKQPAIPGRYKGGVEQWTHDHTRAIAMYEELLNAGSPHIDRPIDLQAEHTQQLILGLHRAWDGDVTAAHALLAGSARSARSLVERCLPGLTSSRAPNLAHVARDGAAAAAIVGEAELSARLFAYAERFAAALVSGEEEHPAAPTASLHPAGYYPVIRAYSLLRLGRLDGFHALLYLVPMPEARRTLPVWAPATLEALLASAEVAMAVGVAKHEAVASWPSVKGQIPLLRSLAAYLASPEAPEMRVAAQQALANYYRRIRNLADFHEIALLVLDLQIAFPPVFDPVLPVAMATDPSKR